jgi:excinuclease ABC subunit C
MHKILESKTIPESAGCYLFKDEKDKIIYVGKSKYLPKRVASYFQKNHDDRKTIKLVESIRDVEFIICESEAEALVTEENLIKLYQPKFNIRGKDDKTIRLHLTIPNENYPRIDLERGTESTVSGYHLAQFTSGMMAREVYDLLHQVFPLRSCSYNLSDENLEQKKFKPCLEFSIGNCLAPCLGEIKKPIYTKMIRDIKEIFNFNPKPAFSQLVRLRNYHAKQLEFEKCGMIQSRLKSLQTLVKKIEPLRLNRTRQNLLEIGKYLGFKESPLIIDAFDNSHTNGQDGVACSIRFVMGEPEKSSYRKFIIKEAKVGDDIGSFEEVLTRRYSRILKEKTQLPNLLIMDGGKTQLNIARKVLGDLGIKIDIIGVSKDDRHRAHQVHTMDGKTINLLDVPHHELLAKISDEIHRFTITFHKHRRDKI